MPINAHSLFRSLWIRCLVLLLIAVAALPAAATEEYCVNTASEIQNAIRDAVDDDVVIRVVQGTYLFSSSPMAGVDEPSLGYNVTLIGGYNSTCTTRSLDPHLTTFAGTVPQYEISTYDSIVIESIRFTNFAGGIVLKAASYGGNGPDEKITLRRVWMENLCTSGACDPQASNSPNIFLDSDEVSLSHVVAVHNGHSSCTMVIDTYDLDDAYISYSVFADNGGDGLCMTRSDGDEDYRLWAQNNIFYNNDGGQDIRTRRSPFISLRNNIYFAVDLSPTPDTPPVGGLSQNPQFTAPASSEYQLNVNSPAINSGTLLVSNPTSQDINGGPRQTGSAPDRGAYESNVDDTIIITVTNVSDQLAPLVSGSLRAAIVQANGDPGLNYIRFNIPGGCPRIINLNGPLPDITDRVIIEGYTQPGSEPNTSTAAFNATICIGIRGDLSDNYGFRIPASVSAAHYLQLSGVAIGGFDVAAIELRGGAGSWIHGVQFAGELGSTAIGNSAVNVRVGASGDSYYNLIGGDSIADRNLIPFAYEAGVELIGGSTDSHENYVTNNLIGTSAGGSVLAPNQIGVYVSSPGNRITDNVISGNTTHGIQVIGVGAHDNVITNNRVGLKVPSLVACFPPPCVSDSLPNGGIGIRLLNDASDNNINSNKVAYNGDSGIRIVDGQHNSLLSNTTWANGEMGIDVGPAGPNPTDNDGAPGAASQPNRGLNAPALTTAHGGKRSGLVRSILLSTNNTYIVQLFSDTTCDAQDHGEGRIYHSSALVTIDDANSGSNGSVVFDIPVKGTSILTGRAFSLVARDVQGNTSEYSQCATYTCDQIFAHSYDGSTADSCPAP